MTSNTRKGRKKGISDFAESKSESESPAYIIAKRSSPFLLSSMEAGSKLLVKFFPGSEGMLTRGLSLSNTSLKYSNSLYR